MRSQGSRGPPVDVPFPNEPPYSAYVGNLSFSCTENDLRHFVAASLVDAEVVSVRLPVDRQSGRGRGFAYVEVSTADGLRAALGLDGQEFMGRQTRVNIAAPQGPRKPREDVSGAPESASPPGPSTGPTSAASAAPVVEGPEPAFFFELPGTSKVMLVRVVEGVTFSEDDLPPKARRLLLSRHSGGGSHALCKVVSVEDSGPAQGHGEYENVNIDQEGLTAATKSHIDMAAHYGAGMAAVVTFGRLGVVAPYSSVGTPLLPSQLCDLLADPNSAVSFFAPELGGVAEAQAAMRAMETGGWFVEKDSTLITATYADGKKCLVSPTPEAAGPDGARGVIPMDPTDAQVAQELALLGGRQRDPFLRGDPLADRSKHMVVEPTGRISLPPPPMGSKDYRVYGAKCLETQRNERQVSSTLAAPASGSSLPLVASAVTTTYLDHPDITNPSYKLQPEVAVSKLVLGRGDLHDNGRAPTMESLEGAAAGYQVYCGLHFCAGLSCDFRVVLCEMPPASEDVKAWSGETSTAFKTLFTSLEVAKRVACEVNAECSASEQTMIAEHHERVAAASSQGARAISAPSEQPAPQC